MYQKEKKNPLLNYTLSTQNILQNEEIKTF